ncbi:hypothetical protein FWF93_01460 [Candidatus Saccharibacteria bacterium]|nr:hypothetical protein [Candidatus Saccharibacteria bacterium]
MEEQTSRLPRTFADGDVGIIELRIVKCDYGAEPEEWPVIARSKKQGKLTRSMLSKFKQFENGDTLGLVKKLSPAEENEARELHVLLEDGKWYCAAIYLGLDAEDAGETADGDYCPEDIERLVKLREEDPDRFWQEW